MRRLESLSPGVFVTLLVVMFVALRVAGLTTDPPARLVSHYQDLAFSVFDEGWWTANARQAVLFGESRGTGFDLFWVSPVFTFLMSLAFAAAGPSLGVARLVSIGLGALGVALLYGAARRGRDAGGERTARIAALLVTVSFAGAHLGRLALPETAGTTLGLAAAWALRGGGTRAELGAGLLAALAALTKPHFAFLVPAFALAGVVLAVRRGGSPAAAAGRILLGAAIPVAIWGAYVVAHADEALDLVGFYLNDRWFAGGATGVGAGWNFVKPLAQVLIAGVVYRHPFLVHLPGVFLLGVLALPFVVRAGRRPRSSAVPDAVVVFGAWALVGGVAITALPFQPFRYYLPLVPALAVLAAWFLARDDDPDEGDGGRIAAVLRWAVAAALLTQIVFAILVSSTLSTLVARGVGHVPLLSAPEFHLTTFLLQILRRGLGSFSDLPHELAYVAALALLAAVSLGLAGIAAVGAARFLARPLASPARRGGVILLVLIGYQALLWVTWWPGRATTLRDMGRELDARLPSRSVVSPAGTYSLESGLRFDSRAVRERRMFDPDGAASHFVVLGAHPFIGILPEGEIERRWPGSVRLATFELTGGYRYHLYRAGSTSTAPSPPP